MSVKTGKYLLLLFAVCGLASCEWGGTAESENEEIPGFDLANLDTTADPCHDFYQFVAGGWKENNPIPPSEGSWGSFHVLREQNKKRVKSILSGLEGKADFDRGSREQLVGDYYISGMDSAVTEEKSTKTLHKYLDSIDDASTRSELLDLTILFLKDGIGRFYSVSVSPDKKNSSEYALYLSQSGLGLPDKDYYSREDSAAKAIRAAYKEHIAHMFDLPERKGMDGRGQKAAQRILEIETDMAGVYMSREDRRKPEKTYNTFGLEDFAEKHESLGFDRHFKALELEPDSIIVNQPGFFAGLTEIWEKYPLRDWKDYFRWKTIHSLASHLPYAFVKEDFDFYGQTLGGVEEMKPRWKRVQEDLENGLGEQLGYLYVQRHFSGEAREYVIEMVENLRAAYRKRIENLQWMTDETREKAFEKLDAFSYKIGFPDEWKDYSDLNISRSDYIGNRIRLNRYLAEEEFGKLGEPVDKEEWFMAPHTVNAYYNPSFNEIVFPAGILQPPFFDPESDDAINYGGIGGVIGHEFTHGFDDQGSKYDAQGNYSNWWTEKDRRQFESLAEQLAEQYDQYEPLPGEHIKGKMTLGENIADLGGVTLAYEAYQKLLAESDEEPETRGGFTPSQRFFLGWGQVWQRNVRERSLSQQLTTDYHSPAEFRVTGPLSNCEAFLEAFGCKDVDRMKREEAVVIW